MNCIPQYIIDDRDEFEAQALASDLVAEETWVRDCADALRAGEALSPEQDQAWLEWLAERIR